MGASWQEFASTAPELAAAVEGRFSAHIHHIIGTLRADGSPRLSGTEVSFGDGQLRVGMMERSRKLADVLRDPRVELHSAPIEADLAGGDAKVSGRLREAGPSPGPAGSMFELDVELVSLLRVSGDELEITTWQPGRGVERIRRR
jgi:hypothetical protein